MNKLSIRFQRIACAVALGCVVPAMAGTSGQAVGIEVPDAQVEALGIQTLPLQSRSDSVRASFPAQVIVPVGAEQVVSSPVAGLVTQVLVQQFQSVKVGVPLLRIASPELGQLQLQLLQASSQATLARQAVQREQQLFKEGIIAQRRVQEALAAQRQASAALVQAKAALRLSGMSPATIETVIRSGQLQDSIVLSAAQAGTVSLIDAKPGQRVDVSTALLHVTQTDSLWLEVQLPAAEGADWPVGTNIDIAGRGLRARVASLSPTVASSSQTMLLRAVIEGNPGSLRPGELVTVELPAGVGRTGWDVPLSAIAYDDRQAYVFVRTPGGFEARPVGVVASAGQSVRVQGPLVAGEQVAVSGAVALKGALLKRKGEQ